ncbi:MAG: methyltransferase domain-containing protein [Chloroflexi bacterium]|nr:methyltransferase domain-containing protein [Chloroflexota bacterium]
MTDDVRPRCRSCGKATLIDVLDLGRQPLANAFPEATPDQPSTGADAWPLCAVVCNECWLFQLLDSHIETAVVGEGGVNPSRTMSDHLRDFVATVVERLSLRPGDVVVDTASHGGHLQSLFRESGISTLTLEGSPAHAAAARRRGLSVEAGDVNAASAGRIVRGHGPARAFVDNYRLSHVVDPDAFLAGVRALLAPGGMAVLEFDHVLPILAERQFDAIRHGHFTYFGLASLEAALRRNGLAVVTVEELSVYGGALRVWAGADDGSPSEDTVATRVRDRERAAGLTDPSTYTVFAAAVRVAQGTLRAFLESARSDGRLVVGYGAPSRASTLLNAARISADLLPFTVDASTAKQGRMIPGCGIPIHAPERLIAARPDDVLILTWDIADEVVRSLPEVTAWGGRFLVPIPSVRVL